MKNCKNAVKVFFLIFFMIFLPASFLFPWSDDVSTPVTICNTDGNQNQLQVSKTSDGNFIIMWIDERRGTFPGYSWNYKDVYGQKLDASGGILWTENGIPIVEGYGTDITFECQTDVRAINGGSSNTIFSWTDASGAGIQGNKVRINKIDGSGSKLWGDGGVLLQDGDSGSNEQLCSDGEDGVFTSWSYGGFRLWYPRIKAAHFSSSGTLLTNYGSISADEGGGDGSQVSSSEFAYSGVGETLIGWEDDRDGPFYGWRSLRVQKLGTGKMWLPAEGIRVSLPNNVLSQIASDCKIVSDGAGGVICFWKDERNGNGDIFSQRVDSSGTIMWTTGGIPVCTADGGQSSIQAVSDRQGGAIAIWRDSRSGSQIYAQRIDADGNALWTENGVRISSSGNTPRIINTSDGNYLLFWLADKVMAQKIGNDGIGWWQEDGVTVYDQGVFTDYKTIYNNDGAVVVWSNNNIYAQKIYNNGTLDPSSPLTITTDESLPTGSLENAYSQRIGAIGGNGSRYTWEIASGNLPDGLSFNTTTGVISGTPTKLGLFTFSISAGDGSSTDTKEFNVFIQIDSGMEIFDDNDCPAVAKGSSYLLVTRKSIDVWTPSYIYCQFFDDNGYKDGDKLTVYENDWVDRLSVTYNPVNNKYLIVFYGGEYIPNPLDYKLYGIFIDGTTHQAGTPFVIIDGYYRYPGVAVNTQTGQFLVVATENVYGGAWEGIVIDRNGNPETSLFQIGQQTQWGKNCSVAYNPDANDFLVTYTYSAMYYVWGSIVENDGSVGTTNTIATSPNFNSLYDCAVTYNSSLNKYILGYNLSSPERVLGIYVNPDGTASGDSFYISKTTIQEGYVDVAVSGNGTICAFWNDRADQEGEYDYDSQYIYAQQITEEGSSLENDALVTPYTGDKRNPCATVGNADNNFLVMWKRWEGSSYKIYGIFYETTTKGDINNSGNIDISDVILCLRMAIGLDESNLSVADMNESGTVDISDVILVLRKAIGLDP